MCQKMPPCEILPPASPFVSTLYGSYVSITGGFAAMVLSTSQEWTALETLVGGGWRPLHSIHQESVSCAFPAV